MLSHAELVKALWKSTRPPETSDQAWAHMPILVFFWALANLPGKFRGPVFWISLCLLGAYTVWAIVLSTRLKRFLQLRRKPAKAKREAILLSMLDTGIFVELLSGAFLAAGIQVIPTSPFGRTLLLSLYGITVTVAGVTGYHWFVLPSAKAIQSADGFWWKLSLIAPGVGIGIGVIAATLISRLAKGEAGLLTGGIIMLTGAFGMGVFGAGIICEVYIFAKLDVTCTSTRRSRKIREEDSDFAVAS